MSVNTCVYMNKLLLVVVVAVAVLKMHDSQATFGSRCFNKYVIFRFPTSGAFSYSPMLEVLSAVTGDSIAVFGKTDFADASVKVLKRRLAPKIGVPRFRLRLLQDNCPLDDDQTLIDDQTLALQVVQLVILPEVSAA